MIRKIIIDLNNEISQKAGEIQLALKSNFDGILFREHQVNNNEPSSSYKPLVLLGGSSIIVGLFGMLMSDSVRTWHVFLTCAGGFSLGYGTLKNVRHKKSSQVTLDYSAVKNFYMEMAEQSINNACKQWDDYIASKNNYLKEEIEHFITDDKIRSKVMYKTYYLESIKISVMDFVNTLDSLPQNANFIEACISTKMEFLKSVQRAVESAARKQMDQYSEIINILNKNGI